MHRSTYKSRKEIYAIYLRHFFVTFCVSLVILVGYNAIARNFDIFFTHTSLCCFVYRTYFSLFSVMDITFSFSISTIAIRNCSHLTQFTQVWVCAAEWVWVQLRCTHLSVTSRCLSLCGAEVAQAQCLIGNKKAIINILCRREIKKKITYYNF